MFKLEHEWDAREKAGLPRYHSVDQTDIGFRFTEPSSPDAGITAFLEGDYDAMEAAWKGADDVKMCTTSQLIGPQPLHELPDVETIYEAPPGYLAWLACDEQYFAQFGAKFLATIAKHGDAAHVHLMDADPTYAKEVIASLNRPIGLTVEQPMAGPSYYHSIRFCRLAQLMKTRSDPIALLGVDALANRPVSDLPTVPIGMRLRPGRLEPWNQCNASVVIATPEGQTYFDAVADYMFYFWKRNQLRWQIDQAALFFVWKRLGVHIRTLNVQEVDYDYQDDGIVWCNSGRTKWYDNDPSRNRYAVKSAAVEVPSAMTTARAKREQSVERIAYLSCELTSRDLDNRLLIASHLCDMGIIVLLGHFWGVNGNIGRTTPGCHLFTTANDVQARAMQKAVTAGNYVIATDTEGLPLANPIQNVSGIAVSLCDKFLVDSQAHRDLLAERFGDEKFTITGSPRLDYLVNTPIEPIGGDPYVLFNTGLGIINSVWGSPLEALQAMSGAMELTEAEAELTVKAETAALDVISPLIRWLAPQTRVVIRPHPSENAQAWRDAFPALEVVEGASPYPWIKGAQVVIHANSTSGIEAAALGTPALNIDPVAEWGEKFVIKDYNCSVRSAQEAQHVLDAFLNENSGPLAENNDKIASLPLSGAINTARHIAETLKGAKPFKGPFRWSPVDRGDLHRSKFSVAKEELKDRISRINFSGTVKPVDDSTFLMWKQIKPQ